MVKDLIKVMKTCCGKISTYKLYCSIATWIWIALQDPEKKHVSTIVLKIIISNLSFLSISCGALLLQLKFYFYN